MQLYLEGSEELLKKAKRISELAKELADEIRDFEYMHLVILKPTEKAPAAATAETNEKN